ncbi:MAG: DNA-directed RNA polymerase subunit beta' [Candidatus Hydrogenedentes bacterium CG07_land_8_20_14_0_80_42_17]|nr:MAG: DNA-directed RNA polymerase subunit beta' [Candidatus Hydrogenedentes bacterium CG07_land_8_20_14_0_80_42_17]
MWNINEFAAISIRMASPERILEWSHGEVKKPETINYRTLKPELEGLFCERIFGSTKDWECYCGKFKSIRYKGVVCDRCQVEVTHSKVRRERMGHIDLVAPVSHIWYFRATPSKMGVLLGMRVKDLDRVLYFQSFVVTNPGSTPLKKKQLLSEEMYQDAVSTYGNTFKAQMGAEAIRELLVDIDLPQLRHEIREQLKIMKSKQDIKQLIRQLSVVEAFISSGNKPEWMIMTRLPVIPPELRPMVQLDGGRFATSDLNDLYRRVLNRNNRLRRLIELKAPSIIIRNEKRMLQESVDALLDNGRRGRPVKGASNNRVLKSLSDMLKGKQGRFRQNLLGKRVDYSGRSVIVVGPELKLNQCGLPKKMALELFKPFIMRELVIRGKASNIKAAKKMVEREDKEVWEVIEDVIADHPVLLNRAPTLHRLGIQAFQPVLVEGKAIRVHPLVCVAFNADFDGDQMAVHVPLSSEAIVECKLLMMADRNILSPASGKPIITPTQDIVLGIYYLTKERESASQLSKLFADADECLYAYETGKLNLHGKVRVRIDERINGTIKRSIVETTPGRLIFRSAFPDDFEFSKTNKTITKALLGKLIDELFRRYGESTTASIANAIKNFGFTYSTKAGISIGIDDMKVPAAKEQLLARAKEDVDKINSQYERGVITEQERYTSIINLWTNKTDEVAKVMFDEIEADREGFNPIYIMADSGARGSKAQIKQLAGMRGLMADPFGKIRETPIQSNFREGMSVIEFFQSTTGSRKGLTDTALKTANAGYLTRRLVDVSQDVVINELDCGTKEGLLFKSSDEGADPLSQRTLGRFVAEDVEDPRSSSSGIILKAGTYIDNEVADLIKETGIEEIKIRSVLTCQSLKGICQKCYGRDLATGRVAEIGEAVGVIAAQSIGEPGTQLTLRTFHVGGTASADDTYLRARFSGVISSLPPLKKQSDGTIYVIEEGFIKGRRIDRIEIIQKNSVRYSSSRGIIQEQPLKANQKVEISVKNGTNVKAEEEILRIDIIAPEDCKVRSVKKDSIIISTSGKKDKRIEVPAGLRPLVSEGEKISKGDPLVRRSFNASFAGTVKIEKREGLESIKLISLVDENISATSEQGKLIETPSIIGMEPSVLVRAEVGIKEIIGLNPSFRPIISKLSGRIEFENAALQKEGNDHIIIKPSQQEVTSGTALMMIWKGSEYVIGTNDELLVEDGQQVEIGTKISKNFESSNSGTLHIVREYISKDGKQKVLIVRVVEQGDRQMLAYLNYTKPSASTTRSKSLSKVKKQNIKLVSKCHVVRHDLFREYEKNVVFLNKKLEELRGVRKEFNAKTNLFVKEQYILPTQKTISEITEIEQKLSKQREAVTVEKGDLIIKYFSDFLQGARENSSEKAGMTKDITGGLPRVEELFEIRKPKSTPACITPVDGKIHSIDKDKEGGKDYCVIKGIDNSEYKIDIPPDRHITVRLQDEVKAGDLLTDGPVDVHELLKVKAETEVQQYIVSEVQDVYRMQGVEINDKHIEVIVRQMMRKVRIDDPGDTEFLTDDLVDRLRLSEENSRVTNLGKNPATYSLVLLGITKAAKHSDSFISAASFQETTWALTQAAVLGKRDELRGLKEAVIIGHLIPAGTGLKKYREGANYEKVVTESKIIEQDITKKELVPTEL